MADYDAAARLVAKRRLFFLISAEGLSNNHPFLDYISVSSAKEETSNFWGLMHFFGTLSITNLNNT